MANKFAVLFGSGQRWWAPGVMLECMALKQLLQDPGLLIVGARNAGCPDRLALHVRVIELDETHCPSRGLISMKVFDRPGVRIVPHDELELAVEVRHLRKEPSGFKIVSLT